MDVVVDANILDADLWLESQSIRFLKDYLEKTNATLLIPSVVETEVCAHATRRIQKAVADVGVAIEQAVRIGVTDLPLLDVPQVSTMNLQRWQRKWDLFKQFYGHVLPLHDALLEEAVRRAAYRVPPCKPTGEGLRDALIWLQILAALKKRGEWSPVAFVSLNTHDFACTDRTGLRPELRADLVGVKADLVYYPSLGEFLREHAQPISHVTKEWLQERIDFEQVSRQIQAYFEQRWPNTRLKEMFQISEEYRPFYYIAGNVRDVSLLNLDLERFTVWRFDDQRIELSLEFYTRIEGNVECEPLPGVQPSEQADFITFTTHNLGCSGDLLFYFSAQVQEDRVELGKIEDCNPFW